MQDGQVTSGIEHGRLAVVGPGAIGCTFAAVANRAGLGEVPLYGRTAVDRITVRADDGEPVVLSGGVRTDPSAALGPVDWLLLAVKVHQTAAAAPWLRALCGPETVVVALRNGVEHREQLAPFVGEAAVLPTVVWCPAEMLDRETVRLRGLMVLAGRRTGMLRRPDVHSLAVALARECAAVGRAEGALLDAAAADKIVDGL